MELKPGIGIGDLKFGMTKDEIIAKLGTPDRIIEDVEDEETLLLEYYALKLRLSVYGGEGDRLAYMTTSNPDLEYKGQKIIADSVDTVKDQVFGSIVNEWEFDEYDLFEVYGNDEYWISLNVEYGTVVSLELGVMINEEDGFEWPE